MLTSIIMRLTQIRDLAQSRGWHSTVKELAFLNRTAIVVEKDLADIPQWSQLERLDLKLIEINLNAISIHPFAQTSRKWKALRNLKLGYGGLALVRGNIIIGDMWYWTSESTEKRGLLHPDLRDFGFKSWQKTDVYTFDIFVAPGERKNGISAAFQNSAMLFLRARGCTRGFGFYWADNIPAHWCTRVTNKWKKLRAVKVSRFLMFRKTNRPMAQLASSL
jgi:GNAT superfamily N-acetyltransferase